MTTGIIVFLIFFTGLALLRTNYALYLLIAALPAYLIRFSVFGLPMTLLEAMILITFAVWFCKTWLPEFRKAKREGQTRREYPFNKEIIAILILSFLGIGVAGFTSSALGIWKAYFLEPILVFLLVFNLNSTKKDKTLILWAFLISALAVSALAIYQKLTGNLIANPFWAAAETRRAVSFFGYPNAIGLFLAPLIPIFLGWFFSMPYRSSLLKALQKILIIIAIGLAFLAIYAAKSEGALIGVAAAIFIFSLLAGKRARLASLTLGIVILGTIVAINPLRDFAWEKITLQDLSGQIREQQWKETFQALTGPKILTGAGLANYQETVAPYHQEGIFFNRDKIENFDAVTWASSTLRTKYWQPVEIYLYPHNIFLNFWSEIGLLGALAFFCLFFRALAIAIRLGSKKDADGSERYLSLGLAAALVAIFIHGLVDVPYFKNDLAVMFWVIIALIGRQSLEIEKAKHHRE